MLLGISGTLIRSPDRHLRTAVESAIERITEALAADRSVVARCAGKGFLERRVYERGRAATPARRVEASEAVWLLSRLARARPVVYARREELPPEALRDSPLPLYPASGIFVPLVASDGMKGALGVTARAPRRWTAAAVDATQRVAEMVAAALERQAVREASEQEHEERRRAEEETRELREQLARAGRVTMLGELAASLAHELNQPLTAIHSNAQAGQRLLKRRPADVTEARKALGDMVQDCRRASDVISRLRQMFRRRPTERLPLSTGPLIEQVLRMLREEAVSRNVQLVLEMPRDLPLVAGDRVQLEQVVMNLVVNAIDSFSGSNGLRQVTVRARENGPAVEVSVCDNGPGMPPGDLAHAFEPFFSSKPGGMGMGLSICRTIVEAHGGSIAGGNAPEGGSVFEFTLPKLA